MLLSLAEASAACQARSLGRARLGARSGMCGTIFGHVRHGRVWLGALLRRVDCLELVLGGLVARVAVGVVL